MVKGYNNYFDIMSKVRVKEIKRVIGSSDINGMFEEMMGIRDAESDIIIPKMVNVRNTLRYLYKVFRPILNNK